MTSNSSNSNNYNIMYSSIPNPNSGLQAEMANQGHPHMSLGGLIPLSQMVPSAQPQIPPPKPKEPMLRTPLSLLNEVCSKAKTAPQFEISEDGPVHNRRYDCQIRVEKQGFCWEAKGSGRTKKDAKQEAAKVLLLDMDKQVEKLLVPITNKENGSAGLPLECDPEVTGNPVGELNELCLSIKRVPAEYENVSEIGKPHERVYTVACKLGSKLVECGRGKSKKHAKRAAAYAMLKRVREMLKQESPTSLIPDEDENLVEKLETLVLTKKQQVKTPVWKLSDIALAFRNKSGNKLESLQDRSTIQNADPAKLLREVAEEQNFKYEFLDIDKQVENNQFHVLISLYMETMVILFGTGGSKTQARKKAAEEALHYLKILTMK